MIGLHRIGIARLVARWLLSVSLAAWACASALAQSTSDCPPAAHMPTAEEVRAGMRDARDRGFLWRISKGGHSSYLYGTVHAARLEWMFPGPAVSSALRASDTIALELDLLDPQVQQQMAQGMAAQATADALPETLQQRLQRVAQGECLPAGVLDRMGPEMQVASLTVLIGRRDGLDPSYGIDLFLSGWAHAAAKPVVSLETVALQLQTLQMGSAGETQEFVRSALDELESGVAGATLRRITQVWADADLDTLSRYESWCDCLNTAVDRAAMARMLDQRNPGLADGIEALHASGKRVFAAVGSLHMIGRLGLPALLAQRGFRVERVDHAP